MSVSTQHLNVEELEFFVFGFMDGWDILNEVWIGIMIAFSIGWEWVDWNQTKGTISRSAS